MRTLHVAAFILGLHGLERMASAFFDPHPMPFGGLIAFIAGATAFYLALETWRAA